MFLSRSGNQKVSGSRPDAPGDKANTMLTLSPTEPTAPKHLIRRGSSAAGEATFTNNKALETCQIRAQSC